MAVRTKAKSQEKKTAILQLAQTGGRKPHLSDKLGVALKNYTNPKNPAFDEAFAKQIRSERPDWFERSSERKKAALLQAAIAGKHRMDLEISLRTAFRDYTNPKNKSFDRAFLALMQQYAPAWFEKRRRRTKKGAQNDSQSNH